MLRSVVFPQIEIRPPNPIVRIEIQSCRSRPQHIRGPFDLDKITHWRVVEYDRDAFSHPLLAVLFVPRHLNEAQRAQDFHQLIDVDDFGFVLDPGLCRALVLGRPFEREGVARTITSHSQNRITISQPKVVGIEEEIDFPGHRMHHCRLGALQCLSNRIEIRHGYFDLGFSCSLIHRQSLASPGCRTNSGTFHLGREIPQYVYHEPMRHVVWGTAGHIDHGKTTLVKALTGTDCDRLPEERERGITIDLGFAELSEEDMQLHFVDVPGHERLVHTMIAGAAGIDLALLVVAADEGVMPQTREHLEVIRLMGVPGGAVALTKIDTMDQDLVDLVAEEVAELLGPTPFSGVPVVPVSGHTGEGIADLRKVLFDQARHVRPRQLEDRPFREPIDRVFSLTGAGTVLTGTSLWGTLEVGSEVSVLPQGITARVRRLHVHGAERQVVEAGERVAINVAGLSRDDLKRGDQVISPGPWEPTFLVTVRLELLAAAPGPLDEGDEVEVHALAARVPARIDRLAMRPLNPGGRAVAQISLREPLVLFPGDRLVLRRPSPVNTFAGGMVLDPHLRRWRRRDSAALDKLPDVDRSEWPALLLSWIEREELAGLSQPSLAGRLGVLSETIEFPLGKLLEEGQIQALRTQPLRFVSASRMDRLAKDAAEELKRRLAGEEVSAGIPARDFAGRLLPRDAVHLADVLLEDLRRRKVLDLLEGRVVPAGSDRHMTEAGEALARRVEALYRDDGFEAPSPVEAAERLQAKPAAVEATCRYLVQRRQLIRLDGKFLIHRAALDDVAQRVREWEVADFAVGEFKDKFGLTRKLAIPALEWLDSERVTVRQGNRRKIIRRTT